METQPPFCHLADTCSLTQQVSNELLLSEWRLSEDPHPYLVVVSPAVFYLLFVPILLF